MPKQKKYFIALLALLALLLLSVLLKISTTPTPRQIQLRATAINVNMPVIPTAAGIISTNTPATKPAALLGETILRGYATAASTPENDLKLMAQLMDNFTLLIKSSAKLSMSANEDWAAAFRGLNPARERFLPDDHIALNAQHQLLDRWQTPLFFHALGNHRFDLRSAGPDKKMWTGDDLHRNANGSFRRGAELNPPSLLETTKPQAFR